MTSFGPEFCSWAEAKIAKEMKMKKNVVFCMTSNRGEVFGCQTGAKYLEKFPSIFFQSVVSLLIRVLDRVAVF